MMVHALEDTSTKIIHWVLGARARGLVSMPTGCGLHLEAQVPDDVRPATSITCPTCELERIRTYLEYEDVP